MNKRRIPRRFLPPHRAAISRFDPSRQMIKESSIGMIVPVEYRCDVFFRLKIKMKYLSAYQLAASKIFTKSYVPYLQINSHTYLAYSFTKVSMSNLKP